MNDEKRWTTLCKSFKLKSMKTRSLSLALVLSGLILLFGCAGSLEHKREADSFYKVGVSYLKEGKLQMAFVQFQKALQLDPDNKNVLNSLGLVYLQLEEYDKAEELFLKSVSIDPEFSDAYNNLGVTYMRERQWAKAVGSFKKALLNPLYQTPEKAFYNLGTSYYRMGKFNLSANALRDAIKRAPQFSLAYFQLALVLNKEERYGEAATALQKGIDVDATYGGDRTKFMEDVRLKLLTAQGDDREDYTDYLEMLKY